MEFCREVMGRVRVWDCEEEKGSWREGGTCEWKEYSMSRLVAVSMVYIVRERRCIIELLQCHRKLEETDHFHPIHHHSIHLSIY